MADLSVISLDIVIEKETPQEFATRNLEKVRSLTHKYDKLLDPIKLSVFNESFKVLSEKLMFEGSVDTRLVVELSREVAFQVTSSRAKQIRTLVERNMENWQDSRFGEEFSKTQASLQAIKWLEGAASGNTRVVRNWIDAGWVILTDSLNAPWGKCSCGKKLLPRLIGSEGSKKWRTFEKCGDCYHAQKEVEERQMLATLGEGKHRVKKPGSAAKHGHRMVQEGARRKN